MAESFMLNVKPNFQLTTLVGKLSQIYTQNGFTVTGSTFGENADSTQVIPNVFSMKIEKGNEGITKVLGLGKSIVVNFSVANNILSVNFSGIEWTGKIITIAIGWLLCFFPLITGIVGVVGQLELPKDIENNCRFIVASMK